jgi:nucleoside-diphosphate-sugar epimerase
MKLAMERKAMELYYRKNWPVTIIRPSSLYGSQNAIFREIGVESSWIDRIRKDKPFITGNPQLVRNLLHVKDGALGFALMIEHQNRTIGQAYNLVGAETLGWGQWHDAVMDVLGKRVETVEVPIETLDAYGCPTMEQYKMSWQYHGFFSGEKIRRHIPEFVERVPLAEGIAKQLEFLDRNGLIPNSDEITWEDDAIRAQLNTRIVKG